MFENGEVLIQKFGGSSMGSVERIKLVAERIAQKANKGRRMVIVVSAMGDTTDELIELMNSVTANPERREIDCVMATGEMISSALTASALSSLGVKAKSFNAFNLQLLSELNGKDYDITNIGKINNLCDFLQPGCVAVVAGFQGITADGDLTTLGRGGSDLTAVVLAKWLGQKVCEKYTDEDGIYTADPRVIPDARKIWHLNYDEMLELAYSGNGILHPRAISTAKNSEIRIHVRSSFTSEEGSVVGPDGDRSIAVKSITVKKSGNKNIITLVGSGIEDNEDIVSSFKEAIKPYNADNFNQSKIKFSFEINPIYSDKALFSLHKILINNIC